MEDYGLLLLFATTLFVSSALLFWIQPMIGKMLLPMLGGAPAVWNTCMVFFQAMLLAGYGYVHGTTTKLGLRRQAAIHLGVLLLPLFILPVSIPTGWMPPAEQSPVAWLLLLLLVSLGLPFFVVSTTAPMLQKWFATTGHPSSKDPYFLYAASNLGSMLALLGYPALVEPNLRLADQSWEWAVGYGMLVLLTVACAFMLWRSPAGTQEDSKSIAPVEFRSTRSTSDKTADITPRHKARWVIYAFVPSSLTLGVTTHLTTNITPMPLFWVIPLALYLLTFVLVFARNSILSHRLMLRLMPFAILSLVLSLLLNMQGPLWFLISLHLTTFFVAAMVCHSELARTRPSAHHLTEFYLWIAVGGVLGGVFNALIAPVIFTSVIEYPLVLVLACLLRPRLDLDQKEPQIARWLDFTLPLALGLLAVGLALTLKPGWIRVGLTLGLPIVLCFSFRNRPIRFAIGVGAVMLAGGISAGENIRVLERVRSFFGVYRVVVDSEEKYHLLVHGNIDHGRQSLDPSRSKEPLSYFYRTSPIGQVFKALSRAESKGPVAIIGLGAGAMACYGEPGQQFTFYEIDPVIERIARNPQYFTYLRDCSPRIDVILGDGRLSVRKALDRHYSLIVLDAFTSDAVPIHLLTREAIKLYLTKLADGGILAFNISNLYVNLQPVLASLAQDLGLICLAQDDLNISEAEQRAGKSPSQWVVMARTRDPLAKLSEDSRWTLLSNQPGKPVWTDDFSNILSIIRWN